MKIVIIGEAGSGKTTYLNRLLGSQFFPQYHPTMRVSSWKVTLEDGSVFKVVDTIGGDKFHTLPLKREIDEADGVILMFDLTSRLSWKNLAFWKRMVGGKPAVIVGNKRDIPERKIHFKETDRGVLPFVEVSCRKPYQLEKPLLLLRENIKSNTC